MTMYSCTLRHSTVCQLSNDLLVDGNKEIVK